MVTLRVSFAGLLLFCFSSLNGQIRHMLDTIRHDLKKPATFVVGLDGKNSFIRDLKLNLYGVQVGYLFNKRTNIHVGFYTTFNRKKIIYDNPTASPGETDANTIRNKFGMSYLNLEGEYYFFNESKWRFSFPAGIGIGTGWTKFYKADAYTHTKYALVIPVELGFNATYKLNWWVWLGAGIGTRASLASQRFNAPFFTYGLQFQTEEIIKRSRKLFRF